jgi:hypothetical protein
MRRTTVNDSANSHWSRNVPKWTDPTEETAMTTDPVSDLDAVVGRVEKFAVLLRENPGIFIGLEADLRTLLDALAEARADAARLDWLDKQGREEGGSYGYTDPRHVWTAYGRGKWAHNQKKPHGIENHEPHDTLRAAIDAARGGEAGT